MRLRGRCGAVGGWFFTAGTTLLALGAPLVLEPLTLRALETIVWLPGHSLDRDR